MSILETDSDLDFLRKPGVAQLVLDFDTGEHFYRLHPDAVRTHKHLIQHDDEVARVVFQLYALTAQRSSDSDRAEVLHRCAVLFRDRCNRNLLRLIQCTDVCGGWQKIVRQLGEDCISRYDP